MIANKIISVFKNAQTLAILPHISVDGDGLGSSLALGIALKKIGKSVTIILEEDIPYMYKFLPDIEMVKVYMGQVSNFDVAVALDTGDLGRLGERVDIFNGAGMTVNIDHHNTNTEFAFYNYVHPEASSVGELIYQFLKMMGLDITQSIATCLYVAIASDTGGFKYSNTTAITHQITADLVNNGANVSELSQRIFDNATIEKTRLIGLAVNSLELFENGKIAFITITDDMLKSVGANDEDCDGLVNIARNIRGVEVAVLFRQKNANSVKVNLRSKEYVDVSSIAGIYSGGGHKRAAGCMVDKEISKLKQMLLLDIKEEL